MSYLDHIRRKPVRVSLLSGLKPPATLNLKIDKADPSLVLSFYHHEFRLSNPKRVLCLKVFFRGVNNLTSVIAKDITITLRR